MLVLLTLASSSVASAIEGTPASCDPEYQWGCDGNPTLPLPPGECDLECLEVTVARPIFDEEGNCIAYSAAEPYAVHCDHAPLGPVAVPDPPATECPPIYFTRLYQPEECCGVENGECYYFQVGPADDGSGECVIVDVLSTNTHGAPVDCEQLAFF